MSKAAVHHITRCMATEWAQHGVRVNAVAPSYIETPMVLANTPMGRMGRPDEIASAVLSLASDASSLMTGSIVDVDAGYICW